MEERYTIEVYSIPTARMYSCKIGNRTLHSADIQNILDFISEKKTTPNDKAVMGFYEDNPNGKD
jgi:hypothetical protein